METRREVLEACESLAVRVTAENSMVLQKPHFGVRQVLQSGSMTMQVALCVGTRMLSRAPPEEGHAKQSVGASVADGLSSEQID